jgi:hypothetical protein
VTSERQILANRRNAQKSTGPRTAAGKGKVRVNALKHGLAARTLRPDSDPSMFKLAQLVVSNSSADMTRKRAWAEATSDLQNLERHRQRLTERMMMALQQTSSGADHLADELIRQLHGLERYERHLHARLRRLEC